MQSKNPALSVADNIILMIAVHVAPYKIQIITIITKPQKKGLCILFPQGKIAVV